LIPGGAKRRTEAKNAASYPKEKIVLKSLSFAIE
jgi:hypothetical protein